MKERKSSRGFIVKSLIGLVFIIAIGIAYQYYYKVFSPNVLVNSNLKEIYFYIPTNSSFKDVVNNLVKNKIISKKSSFTWVSKKANYVNNVRPGRYLLTKNLSNIELVRMLRQGEGVPVDLTFSIVDYKDEFAGIVGGVLEVDSLQIIRRLNDNEFLNTFGFNTENILTMFIPNTYEFYWNTGDNQFFTRMNNEYNNFWNSARLAKAKEKKLTQIEVSILASIIQKESNKKDEWERIAGVYLNRLERGMLLQADPTITYLYRGKTIKRVKKYHYEIKSPYNTYKNAGLPPGPIAMAEIPAIDAVLNAEDHNYLYFCAKIDGSGYHHFSVSLSQHNKYAREYWRWLNRNNIR